MSNRLTLRHGTGVPPITQLLSNELGYSTDNNILYIRRTTDEIDEVVPLTFPEPPRPSTFNYTLSVTPEETSYIITDDSLEDNVAVIINLNYASSLATSSMIEQYRMIDFVDGGEVVDENNEVQKNAIKLVVNGEIEEAMDIPLNLLVIK